MLQVRQHFGNADGIHELVHADGEDGQTKAVEAGGAYVCVQREMRVLEFLLDYGGER